MQLLLLGGGGYRNVGDLAVLVLASPHIGAAAARDRSRRSRGKFAILGRRGLGLLALLQ